MVENEELDGFDKWFGGRGWREMLSVDGWASCVSKLHSFDGDKIVIEPITIHFDYTEEPGVIEDLFGCFFDDQTGDEENE